jgi:hypothetical protein
MLQYDDESWWCVQFQLIEKLEALGVNRGSCFAIRKMVMVLRCGCVIEWIL